MIEAIRTFLLLVLGLVVLLCLVMPPTYLLWQIKIAVSEYPFIATGAALLILALPMYNRGAWLIPQVIITIEIFTCSLYPVVSAMSISNRLEGELSQAFGNEKLEANPFAVTELFSSAQRTVQPQTLTYLKSESQNLNLDFYPTDKANAPVVVVIHGGGWNSGDRKQMDNFNYLLAAKGYNVAAMDYSLAPDFQNPKQVSDVKHCLSFLKHNADKLKIDAANIVLLGRSAGGQIALQAGYSECCPDIKGIVAFYSPADMVWGYSLSTNEGVLKSKTLITDYIGGTLEQFPERYDYASALSHVKKGCPPTLMIHGRQDNIVAFDHNLHLIEKLKPAGIKYYLLDLPWATHGGDYHLFGPTGQLSTYSVLYFLKSVTTRI